MLCAEEVALQARLVQQLATVRKTELDYLLARFQSVGTQAALVCGFTMSSLTQLSATDPDPKASTLTVHAFYFTSFVGLLAGLHTVVVTLFLCTWSPGLALRGPTGSMAKALDAARKQRKHVDHAFVLALFAFMLQTFFAVWVLALNSGEEGDNVDGIVATMLICMAVTYSGRHLRAVHESFYGESRGSPGQTPRRPESAPAVTPYRPPPRRGAEAASTPRAGEPGAAQPLGTPHRRGAARLFGSRESAAPQSAQALPDNRVPLLDNPITAVESHPDLIPHSHSGHDLGEDEGLETRGVLFKRNGRRGRVSSMLPADWAERYFVLSGTTLRYWKTEEEYLDHLDKRQGATGAPDAASRAPGISEQVADTPSTSGQPAVRRPSMPRCAVLRGLGSASAQQEERSILKHKIDLRGFEVSVDMSDPHWGFSLTPALPDDGRNSWYLRAPTESLRLHWAQRLVTATNMPLGVGSPERGLPTGPEHDDNDDE